MSLVGLVACRWVRHKRYPHLALTGWTPITVFSSSALTHLAQSGIQLAADTIELLTNTTHKHHMAPIVELSADDSWDKVSVDSRVGVVLTRLGDDWSLVMGSCKACGWNVPFDDSFCRCDCRRHEAGRAFSAGRPGGRNLESDTATCKHGVWMFCKTELVLFTRWLARRC